MRSSSGRCFRSTSIMACTEIVSASLGAWSASTMSWELLAESRDLGRILALGPCGGQGQGLDGGRGAAGRSSRDVGERRVIRVTIHPVVGVSGAEFPCLRWSISRRSSPRNRALASPRSACRERRERQGLRLEDPRPENWAAAEAKSSSGITQCPRGGARRRWARRVRSCGLRAPALPAFRRLRRAPGRGSASRPCWRV